MKTKISWYLGVNEFSEISLKDLRDIMRGENAEICFFCNC